MKDYKPIEIKKYPAKSFKISTEGRKFKKFKEFQNMKLDLTCTGVSICKENPNLMTFYVFDTMYYFDLLSDSVVAKFPHITDKITSGLIRDDGKLVLAGLNNGTVNLYEPIKKTCIRSYYSHKLQVTGLDFSSSKVNFATCSNDMSIKIHDLSRTSAISSFEKCHKDYIKCVKYLDENTLISGGSDKILKVWDLRANHKSYVKSLENNNVNLDLLVLSNTHIISTSDNSINEWDLKTDQIVKTAIPIQNCIEKICVDSSKTRLFIVAAEKFVKVLELSTFKSLYSIKFDKEVSGFDIAPEMDRYGVGFVDGEISIKGRSHVEDEEGEDLFKEKEDRDMELLDPTKYATRDVVKNYKYFSRGQYDNSDNTHIDVVVPFVKKRKLDEYDVYLKKFEYHNALDAALKKNNTEIIISVIEELIDRNALKLALLNRSKEDLELLLKFLLWKLRDPKTIDILIHLASEIIDYYCVMFGHSKEIDEMFGKLLKELSDEVDFQEKLVGVNAKIDTINNLISMAK